jgi:acyl-CoA reductase-like NAD-dependent aldehyde dehydrogenase
MLHIPILRNGKPYESVEKIELVHHVTGEAVAQVSMANSGLVGRDIRRMDDTVLEQFTVKELMEFCKIAGKLFMEGVLPVGDDRQSFEDYVKCLSATTGMPQSLCRGNAGKIFRIFDEIEVVVAGLTRGFDLTILDRGYGEDEGRTLSYFREGRIFGAVLPSNSPGVHSLWIPAVALKAPIALKPGREEPWSPYRIIQAFIAAGLPAEAFGFYPTDHGGAGELLRSVDRSMLFGDASTTKMYRHDPRVELHGPGYSKVILDEKAAGEWEKYLDVMVQSISANGGRSCINASGIWTPKNGDKIAEAIARELAKWRALPADHPEAKLALFANPTMAERINMMIDGNMPGARDLTQEIRGTPRLVKQGRCAWLLPTIIRAERDHALANKEFLFPFAAVVECPQEEIPEAIGDTLVGTVITEDATFRRRMMACDSIDRLNIGPVPTFKLSWDQPHEGNLFEHLYRQRAFQIEGVVEENVATGVMP